jgi:hypothetical protein
MKNTFTHLLGVLALLITTPLVAGQQPAAQASGDPVLPAPPITGPLGRFGLVDQALAVSAPVWEDEQTKLTAQAGLRSELLQTRPSSIDDIVPDQLWNLNLGLDGTLFFEGGWSAGGGLCLGYKGARLLEPTTTLTADVKAFIRLPASEQEAWTLSLTCSPLALPVPTPTVSYTWTPSQRFSADVGVPVPVLYTPARASPDGHDRIYLGAVTTITGQFRINW